MSEGDECNLQDFPQHVGRYEILLPIASGGMATVYLARARATGGFERDVALKLTHAQLRENQHFAAGLLEEAKLAAKIRHRNVVSVLDVGDDPRGLFLVMDYVEGDTLASLQRHKDRPLPPPVALRILVDALGGLHAAHELRDDGGIALDVVHRDFSPQNILVAIDGTGLLTDFGIAKAATRLSDTITGVVKGKIAYMSPEQARGDKLDRRCDVWAAGVIAWELLARRRLQELGNDVTTLLRIITEQPPRLRSIDDEIPDELDEVVASALTMDLEDRCPTAETFANALTRASSAYGGLADHRQVAQHVQAVVQDKLERRRKRAVQVVKLRVKMAKLAKVPHEEPSTEDPEPRTKSGSTMARDSLAESEDAPTLSNPIAAEVGFASSAELLLQEDISVDVERVRTDTTSSAEVRRNRGPSPLVSVAGGAALLVVLAAGVYWSFIGRASEERMLPAAPESAVAVQNERPPAEESVAPAATPEPSHSIGLVSNAPLAELRIGSRSVEIPMGSSRTEVRITQVEHTNGFELHAKTTDGRRYSARVEPGVSKVHVNFVARPRSKPTAPLATNPYPL